MAKNNTIGSSLKRLRKQKNISQQLLGDMVGVNVTVVSRWEVGRVLPNLEMAIKLAKALEVSMDIFCGLENTDTGKLEILAKKAQKLDKNKLKVLEVVLEEFVSHSGIS